MSNYGPPPGYGAHQGYGPPHGYPQPPPPKKGMGIGTVILIVFGGIACLVLGTCVVCVGSMGSAMNKASVAASSIPSAIAPAVTATATATVQSTTTAIATAAPTTTDATIAFPWLATVKANCDAYKVAANQIKKSAIFESNNSTIAATTIKGARGKLTTLSTNQGGSELTIEIDVGDDVEFKTETLFSPIRKGSAVYNAAADLSEGQCVIFSASGLKPSSLTERSKVCDAEYFANITALKACD